MSERIMLAVELPAPPPSVPRRERRITIGVGTERAGFQSLRASDTATPLVRSTTSIITTFAT